MGKNGLNRRLGDKQFPNSFRVTRWKKQQQDSIYLWCHFT